MQMSVIDHKGSFELSMIQHSVSLVLLLLVTGLKTININFESCLEHLVQSLLLSYWNPNNGNQRLSISNHNSSRALGFFHYFGDFL